jgi:peptide/nickel transport system ATP-binding protein
MEILTIENLSVEYYRQKKVIQAVRDASLTLKKGETLAIVGESGSGKSTMALSVLKLIFGYEGKIVSGKVLFKNQNLLEISENALQDIRGKEISIVFQDPFASLNPVLTIGEQISETIRFHSKESNSKDLNEISEKILSDVMLKDSKRILTAYPHQLSGGQRQRICMAMAIANRPEILIADEPTTALDVTIQKEIMDLLDKLKSEFSLSIILITHNLPLAIEKSGRIAVMYAGCIVELANAEDIFKNPCHPYTQGLISSIPKLKKSERFILGGQPPDLSALPQGCKFRPRCAKAMEICAKSEPDMYRSDSSEIRCFLFKT